MPGWMWIVAFFIGYLIVMGWVLPKMGVPT